MYNNDNILYFPKNIDLRICPKNGFSSNKNLFFSIMKKLDSKKLKEINSYNPDRKKMPESWRQNEVLIHGDPLDLPFRKDSVRFAIKRDPIERFKSTVEMLELGEKYSSVSEILDELDSGNLLDIHFCPQYFFMGSQDNYHYVYDLSNYEDFLIHILSFYDIKYNRSEHYIRSNISNNSDPNIIQSEREKGGRFRHQPKYKENKSPQKFTDTMTSMDYFRVRTLYKKDYDNGWK